MNVDVKLVTRQTDEDNVQESRIEAVGTFERCGDAWRLCYTEPKTEEAYGADVQMTIYVDSALIRRKGPLSATMPLQAGKRHTWKYDTPYGRMEFPVFCEKIEGKFTATGGRFFAAYTVETAGETAGGMRCTMEISVKEVAQ